MDMRKESLPESNGVSGGWICQRNPLLQLLWSTRWSKISSADFNTWELAFGRRITNVRGHILLQAFAELDLIIATGLHKRDFRRGVFYPAGLRKLFTGTYLPSAISPVTDEGLWQLIGSAKTKPQIWMGFQTELRIWQSWLSTTVLLTSSRRAWKKDFFPLSAKWKIRCYNTSRAQ